MRENAMGPFCELGGRRQTALNAWRFGPLCKLGYTISGRDDKGFTATDRATGKEIRRRNFDDFAKAVRASGLTRTCRSRLLTKRATPDHRIRQQLENQRLQLLVMKRREACPKRTPKAKTRAAAPARRRLRLNNSRNFPA